MRKRLTITLAILLIVVGILHLTAIVFSLYWLYWWFDIPMHFLGGAIAALISIIICFDFLQERLFSRKSVYLVVTIGALLIGFLWELYEYQTGLTFNAIGNYPLDTGKDLLVDAAGALVLSLFIRRYFLSIVSHG